MNTGSLRPSGTATATDFVALVLPYSRHITPSLISKKSAATPFREPLQFIVIAVMSVMSSTFPYTYGVLHDGGLTKGLGTVMPSSCSSSLVKWLM